MKPLLTAGLLLAALGTATAAENPTTARNNRDQQDLQGTWTPSTAELGGQPMPESILKTISLNLSRSNYVATVAGQADRGTWTVDATAAPKTMSITGVNRPNSGKTFPAIYELKGDRLRICYDLSGKKHPTEFKTTAGTQLYLVNYRRQPAAEADGLR